MTSSEGKEGFTELTLRALEAGRRCTALSSSVSGEWPVQEIRLPPEDNGQARADLRNGLTVPVSRRYLKKFKEAIGL